MIPLPPNVVWAIRIAIVGILFWCGWAAHGVYQGYLENEAREDMEAEHAERVESHEASSLEFALTMDAISTSTAAGVQEINRANLKPETITIYVDKPGEVVCPLRSQWTPDAVRLFNDPGQAAPGPDADRGDGAVRGAGSTS